MKKIWINCAPWNKQIATTALESGADALLVPEGFTKKVKELGLIKTVASDGDIKLDQDVVRLEIKSKQDEEKAARIGKSKLLLLKMQDWTIIPLENLIAQTEGIFVEVSNAEEARTALQVLEKGVAGVFLDTSDLNEIKKTVQLVKKSLEKVKLEVAKITRIETLDMGDRVCIDTCTNMQLGEGMLIGNASSAFFLVHSESVENPYVEPRPFRVNAGPVHAYTLAPGGKTKYLSELKSGDEVLVVNSKGATQIAIVGRIKVEKRPLMLVEGVIGKEKISLILQNAETIRLVSPEGKPLSIVNLKVGAEVLACLEEAGRHFGMKISETITEK